MKNIYITIILILFISCQYKNYSSIINVFTRVDNITPHGALLIGEVNSKDTCKRGFIISKSYMTTFDFAQADSNSAKIVWANQTHGKWTYEAKLRHRIVYAISSFIYYENREDSIIYGNTVIIKTP